MKTNECSAAEVAGLLLSYGVVKLSPESPFTWASGMKSPIYCNNRDLLSLAKDEDRDFIVKSLGDNAEFSFLKEESEGSCVIVGVATGAIPWSAMVAYYMGLPYGYVIAAPKDHGADSNKPTPEEEQARLAKCLIGKFPKGAKVIIIEDLISTGGSSLHAVKAVRAAGYEVVGMLALFTYGFKEASKAFAEADCDVVALSDYNALLEKALEMKLITGGQRVSLQEWRKDPRAWSQVRGGK